VQVTSNHLPLKLKAVTGQEGFDANDKDKNKNKRERKPILTKGMGSNNSSSKRRTPQPHKAVKL
jgi:hypothetical protein